MDYNYKELTSKLLTLDQFTLARECLKSIDNPILTGQLIRKLAKSYTTQPQILLDLLSVFFNKELVTVGNPPPVIEEPVVELDNNLYVVETPVFKFNKIQKLILVCLYRLNQPASSKEIVKFSQRIIQYFTDESTRDNLMKTYEGSNTSRLKALIRSNTRILVREEFLICDKSAGYNKFKYSLSDIGNLVAVSFSDDLIKAQVANCVSA